MTIFCHGTSEHDCRYGESVCHLLVTMVMVVIKSRYFQISSDIPYICDGLAVESPSGLVKTELMFLMLVFNKYETIATIRIQYRAYRTN